MKEKLVILGAGESGTGAAILAVQQGWEVFVSDMGPIKPNFQKELEDLNISWEQEQHTGSKILEAALIIKSPGIPDTAPIVVLAHAKNIPVISEIEFAFRYTQSCIVAITGTNGKTTTTALTYHLLKQGGLDVAVGGNIGHSFARLVARSPAAYYVLELSSFQLDGCPEFRPHIAILTNITPDHMDRYEYKIANYARSKFSIGKNQGPEDFFIWCADDPISQEFIESAALRAQKIPFSVQREFSPGAYRKGEELIIDTQKTKTTIPMADLTLRGIHNTYNSLASAVAANLLELKKDNVRESLSNFQNLEHRLEFVARVNGVDYINDSKATNVNSAWYALESMDKPVIWIAGGVDKGNQYEELKALVNEKVKLIICLGLDNGKIHQAFQGTVDMIINTTSAKEAVHVANRMSEAGDAVLLSPACASFDLFDNYEERGRLFKEAVRNL